MTERVLFVINHKAGKNKNLELEKVIMQHANNFNYDIDFYLLCDDEHAIQALITP